MQLFPLKLRNLLMPWHIQLGIFRVFFLTQTKRTLIADDNTHIRFSFTVQYSSSLTL